MNKSDKRKAIKKMRDMGKLNSFNFYGVNYRFYLLGTSYVHFCTPDKRYPNLLTRIEDFYQYLLDMGVYNV